MELEFKKQMTQSHRKHTSSNLSVSSKLIKPEFTIPTDDSDEECDIDSLDNQIALMSKQFKKIDKFRDKLTNRQGMPNYPSQSNYKPHEKG